MATIHFVDASNNIGQVYSFSRNVVTRCITFCDQNGTNQYIPTDSIGNSQYDEDMGSYINRYSYSSSKPSIHIVDSNNSICNAYNTVSTISKSHIPAGTYSPSTFRSMIQKYIPANGSRTVRNAFSVTVNGSTYNVPARRAIKYCTTNTAGSGTASTLEIVTFNGRNQIRAEDASNTFYGSYVVYGQSYAGYATFSEYYRFSITVSTDITFI